MQWVNGDFLLDDDRHRLDMDGIVTWLKASYWARARPEAAIRRSWEAAGVVLGLYRGEEMIGCARAITDFTRFSYLSDVYVKPEWRGHGLGRWLVETMIAHPEIGDTRWLLHTDDAHGLYRQCGFQEPDGTAMERPRPRG